MLGRAPVRRYAQRAADPVRLWVQGRLFGLEPPELDGARVLELGCGDGAHLVGVAARHPEMQLVGFDSRPEAIVEGRRLVEGAGLTNLRLEVAEPTALEGLQESFDYVVVLGAYSRAEHHEQQALLATLGRLLSVRGLACLEYDVRPAFRLHELVADVLRRALGSSAGQPTPEAVRRELSSLLEARAGSPVLESLGSELQAWARRDDAWLLAELDTPRRGLMFRELWPQLERHGLRFVCEASYVEGGSSQFRGRAQQLLELQQGLLDREQYVDFLSGRRLRRSVLSRSELQPSSTALPPRCRDLFCVSPLKAGDDGGFLAPSGLKLSIADPLLATVVAIAAGAWPEALGHAELASAVSAKLGAVDSAELERALLLAHERDWVELRPGPTGCARTPGDRPRVSRLNRSELALQRPLTNRLHVPIGLGQGPAAALVAWLDGTRDRAELARLLGQERLVQNQQAGVGIVQQVLEALRTRALLESEAGAP